MWPTKTQHNVTSTLHATSIIKHTKKKNQLRSCLTAARSSGVKGVIGPPTRTEKFRVKTGIGPADKNITVPSDEERLKAHLARSEQRCNPKGDTSRASAVQGQNCCIRRPHQMDANPMRVASGPTPDIGRKRTANCPPTGYRRGRRLQRPRRRTSTPHNGYTAPPTRGSRTTTTIHNTTRMGCSRGEP